MLQYGYIIHRNEDWNKFTLRLIQILPGREANEGMLLLFFGLRHF